eukprot:2986278-Pleurochrysis_carterae.AAC.1
MRRAALVLTRLIPRGPQSWRCEARLGWGAVVLLNDKCGYVVTGWAQARNILNHSLLRGYLDCCQLSISQSAALYDTSFGSVPGVPL